ncbi:hypothetical protein METBISCDRAFT_23227 [Metschnikowia bicuspidata]|uniref:Uncharacterized protein n=1 Tax=Metschnikowia bicuspidata TaxID=27322 RepID=A0A4P9ZC97_9ASCO|nr:hypothetical protein METBISCDRAFT_23227 [Metschnikowia bicuspidata]
MQFSLAVLALAAQAAAFPLLANSTTNSTASSILNTTMTTTTWVTLTLPSSFSAIVTPIVESSVVTVYTTVTYGDTVFVSPVSVWTSYPTTTSTITKYIMEKDAVAAKDVITFDSLCKPSTVTVTVTEAAGKGGSYGQQPGQAQGQAQVSKIRKTFITSFPVTATFTNGGTTTALTSHVVLTSTESYLTTYTAVANYTTPLTSYGNMTVLRSSAVSFRTDEARTMLSL